MRAEQRLCFPPVRHCNADTPGAHCVQTRSATRVCSVCKYEPGAHVCAVSHVSMPGSGWYVPVGTRRV